MATLDARMLDVHRKLVDGLIEQGALERLADDCKRRLAQHRGRLAELQMVDPRVYRHSRFGISLLASLGEVCTKVSPETRQRLMSPIYPDKLIHENGEFRTTVPCDVIALLSGRIEECGSKMERTEPPFSESVLSGSLGWRNLELLPCADIAPPAPADHRRRVRRSRLCQGVDGPNTNLARSERSISYGVMNFTPMPMQASGILIFRTLEEGTSWVTTTSECARA
jgi:hypothetical protein